MTQSFHTNSLPIWAEVTKEKKQNSLLPNQKEGNQAGFLHSPPKSCFFQKNNKNSFQLTKQLFQKLRKYIFSFTNLHENERQPLNGGAWGEKLIQVENLWRNGLKNCDYYCNLRCPKMDLEKKAKFNIYSMASGIALEKWLYFPGLMGKLRWTSWVEKKNAPWVWNLNSTLCCSSNPKPSSTGLFEDHILEIPISLWRLHKRNVRCVCQMAKKNVETMQNSELQISSRIISDYLMVNSSVDHFPQFSVVKIT